MTRSLPETVQLCADTEKTAVPAALKSRISEYRNRQPIVFFPGATRFDLRSCKNAKRLKKLTLSFLKLNKTETRR